MNIDQFLVLDTIIREGGFRAASEVLNRTQSAISYNIKTLEEELGVSLFDRSGYRPKLTEAGEAIHTKAISLLKLVEEIKILGDHLNRGDEPMISLDVAPTCPPSCIVPILKAFREAHPHTQLRLGMEVFGGDQLVEENTVHLSVTELVTRSDQLETQFWREIPLYPVVSKDHPLAVYRDQTVPQSEMLRHVQVIVSSSRIPLQDVMMGVLEGGPGWRVADFATKGEMIRSGLGWGHLPEYSVRGDLEEGRLVRFRIEHFAPQVVKLYMVRNRERAQGPAAQTLWRLLGKAASNAE